MLFGSTMLELAISLFFIYLLLSLICSAINEWLAGILELRAKTLREGIQNLLNDPDGKALAGEFYSHPLIAGLARRRGKQHLPSYIPGQTFVRVLLDITAPKGAANGPRTLLDLYQQLRDEAANSAQGQSALSATLLMLFDEAGIDLQKVEQTAKTLQELAIVREKFREFAQDAESSPDHAAPRLALENLNELEARLAAREAEVKHGLASVQKNIEGYFDSVMGRVSGWYKRRVQVTIILLALAVSALLNVDTLTIATDLSTNNALRTSIVALAEREVQAGEQRADQSLDELFATRDKLVDLGLPIGWHREQWPETTSPWVSFVLLKLLGILLTTVAVSLGAPFWFDLLNKLVDLRMAGQKTTT